MYKWRSCSPLTSKYNTSMTTISTTSPTVTPNRQQPERGERRKKHERIRIETALLATRGRSWRNYRRLRQRRSPSLAKSDTEVFSPDGTRTQKLMARDRHRALEESGKVDRSLRHFPGRYGSADTGNG